jgi:probable HAF family extracellular repeat protein
MGAPLTLEASRVRVTPRNAGGTSHAVPPAAAGATTKPKGEVRMKSERPTSILAVISLAVVLPISLAAQNNVKQDRPHQYHHYQIVDPGTFGGPQSWTFTPEWARAGFLNNQGTFAASAETSAVDLYCFWSLADCNVTDGFQWHDGVTTNLGVLPGGIGSQVNWISANGLMAGIADNGQPDPLNPALPQVHGVLWDHGQMTDLGTLPGGADDMWANAVNSRGEVAGQAYNTIPDPYSFNGYGYQSRAVYWNKGAMQDLGTLGTGSDAVALLINERGQVLGVSYVDSNPSAFCSGVQIGFTFTTGSFIWDKKNGMQDIGTLGGTCTVAYDLNNRGQVVGQSSQVGDPVNVGFVWDRATGIKQLPTAANLYGGADAINDQGKIVGFGDGPDGQPSAILWKKRGGKWQATYLGSLQSGDCAGGASINASGQVVGVSGPNGCVTVLPFLWEDGGPMVDLNTLVSSSSGIQLHEALQINNRGEIAGNGVDANGNNHAVLLIPCDENHAGVEGCDYSMVDASATAQSAAPRYIPNSTPRPVHPSRSNRFHSSAVGGAAVLTPQISPVPDFTRPPPQFWVAATPLTPSPVNPGGSATSSVTAGIGTNGGGAGTVTVTLSCSVQPSPPLAPTCSISPASYTFAGTPSTLTVSTIGPSGRLLSHPGSGVLYALWLPIIGLVGTGVGLGSNPNGKKRKLKIALLACALSPGLICQLACGGKSSSGTPAGTYEVTITATGFIPVASTSSLTTFTVQ